MNLPEILIKLSIIVGISPPGSCSESKTQEYNLQVQTAPVLTLRQHLLPCTYSLYCILIQVTENQTNSDSNNGSLFFSCNSKSRDKRLSALGQFNGVSRSPWAFPSCHPMSANASCPHLRQEKGAEKGRCHQCGFIYRDSVSVSW